MLQIARSVVGLAGAVGAEQRGHAALVEGELETVQRLHLAVIGPQVPGLSAWCSLVLAPEIGLDDVGIGLHLGRRAFGELFAEISATTWSAIFITRPM